MITSGAVLDKKLLLNAVYLANRNCLPSCRPWSVLFHFVVVFYIEPCQQGQNIPITHSSGILQLRHKV